MRQLSIRSKIIFTVLLIGLACLAAGGIIGYQSGDRVLTESVTRQLTGEREIKKQRVEGYITNELRMTEAVGGARETVIAAKALIEAFHSMHADLNADPSKDKADTDELKSWYQKNFLPKIDRVAGSHTPLEGLIPADPVGRHLQLDYIARNPNPDGERSKLNAAPGNSHYDQVHAKFHELMRRFINTVGFYDINILDAATGDVVYTVDKEVDFGSNMYHGPFAKSGVANVAQRALDPKNGGRAVIEDYAFYMPSAFAPQMFSAVPIIADGQTIGVFVAQIDIKSLNNLLTDNEQWRQTGQGATGEVQLVGEDKLLRSQSRFMIQAPKKFLADIEANGTPTSVVEQIRELGTTILYLKVHNDAIDLALRNQTGVAQLPDTRGVNVIFAYGPVEVAGLRWAILAKQDVAEAFAPEEKLKRELLVAGAVAAILLTFMALACVGFFMRPLRRVVAGMQALAAGESAAQIEVRGNDEFAELSQGYNAMAATIAMRDKQLAAAEQRNDDLLRGLYPAGLAERMRSGAEVAAETVANVTVAVVWMDGLDALADGRNATEMRDILNTLMETIKGAAAAHGVEPVRSMGEMFIAVCGLSSPRLDHAARTLAWTHSAQSVVQRLGTDWANSISLRFGLASGEIDVLILNAAHTAFDVRGRTLATARRIAIEAQPGTVRVDASTLALLTGVEGFEPAAPIVEPVLGTLHTWVRPAAPEIAAGAVKDPHPSQAE